MSDLIELWPLWHLVRAKHCENVHCMCFPKKYWMDVYYNIVNRIANKKIVNICFWTATKYSYFYKRICDFYQKYNVWWIGDRLSCLNVLSLTIKLDMLGVASSNWSTWIMMRMRIMLMQVLMMMMTMMVQGQWERYSKLVVWDNFANYTVCVIQLSASAGFKREKAKYFARHYLTLLLWKQGGRWEVIILMFSIPAKCRGRQLSPPTISSCCDVKT